jgi:hypothetical protein
MAAVNAVLILDGIDKIREAALWVSALSDCNRVVVSYTDEKLLDIARSGCVVRVGDLPLPDAMPLFDRILSDRDRTVTDAQHRYFQEKFQNNLSPTYLKLAADYACGLTSTQTPSFADTSYDVYDAILCGLSRLHGKILLTHTLAYLALSKNGVNYVTLYALVRQDPEIFEEFKSKIYHALPKEELPITVFAHLLLDLEKYISRISYRGTELLILRHSFFREYVVTKLLTEKITQGFQRFWAEQFDSGNELNAVAALSELPSVILHYASAKNAYIDLVCQTDFLEKKFSAGLGDELEEELTLAVRLGLPFAAAISGAVAANFQVIDNNPALALFLLHYFLSRQVRKNPEAANPEWNDLLKLLKKPSFVLTSLLEHIQLGAKYELQTEAKIITYLRFSCENDAVLIVDQIGNVAVWRLDTGVFEELNSPVELSSFTSRSDFFFYGCMPDEDTLILSNENAIWELSAAGLFENGFRYASWRCIFRKEGDMEIGAVNWRHHLHVAVLDGKNGVFSLAEYDRSMQRIREDDFSFLGEMKNASELAYSNDGDLALSFENGVVVSSAGLVYHGTDPALSCIFFGHDQKIAVSTSGGNLLVFPADSVSGMEIHDIRIADVLEQAGEKILYSEKYNCLVIARRSGAITIFSLEDAHCEHIPAGTGQGILTLALSGDEELLVLGSRMGTQVKIFAMQDLAGHRSRDTFLQAWGDRASYAHPANTGFFFAEYYNENDRRKLFALMEGKQQILALNSCTACVFDGIHGGLIFSLENQVFIQIQAV